MKKLSLIFIVSFMISPTVAFANNPKRHHICNHKSKILHKKKCQHSISKSTVITHNNHITLITPSHIVSEKFLTTTPEYTPPPATVSEALEEAEDEAAPLPPDEIVPNPTPAESQAFEEEELQNIVPTEEEETES